MQEFFAGHQPQQFGRIRIPVGEEGRRVSGCHDGRLWVAVRQRLVDQIVLHGEKSARSAYPRAAHQARARLERVVERTVGYADGGADCTDGDRGRPGCHGQRLDGVQNPVRLVYARSGHLATVTEQLLYYSCASSGTSAAGSSAAVATRSRTRNQPPMRAGTAATSAAMTQGPFSGSSAISTSTPTRKTSVA